MAGCFWLKAGDIPFFLILENDYRDCQKVMDLSSGTPQRISRASVSAGPRRKYGWFENGPPARRPSGLSVGDCGCQTYLTYCIVLSGG